MKRVAVRHADETARGEAIVTSDGIEGGAIYALSPGLRRAIAANGTAPLEIDLRPDIEATSLTRQLEAPRRKQSMSAFLRKAGKLSPVAIGLLQEAAHRQGRQLVALPPGELAALVKAVPVELTATASIARAISSAGGIAWEALDPSYMLLQRPGTFAAGEMLDWEAPTGGYLLQACLSTGAAAGRGVVQWLATR